jgi:phosphoribosylamine---glycine ligase
VKVLVLGAGGREHALVRSLAADPDVDEVHAAPGNPGMAEAVLLHPVDPLDRRAVAELAARIGAGLVVVGPEAPLVSGVADAVRARGIACFGPTRQAAQLEGSKSFAKQVMAAAGVPTAMSRVCDSRDDADSALDAFGSPYVVKDDGLAAGKGVLVTLDREEALEHADRCRRVVIEEYLDGPEVSVFGVTDGETVLPMVPAQDYKRLQDGNAGPNTGGMGAYAPLPWAPPDLADEALARVLQPTVDELRRRGTPFSGLLYAGLVLSGRGLRVLEFNARFGDPETQALLALLRSPLGALLHAAATGTLAGFPPLAWQPGAAVAVVLAASGYPQAPHTGDPVTGLDAAAALDGVSVLHSGTGIDPAGRLVTAGGRVLTVVGVDADLEAARGRAYAGAARVHFPGAQLRGDIAAGV